MILKLRQRLDVHSISVHAKFEKIQLEEFSFNGHLACMLSIEDGNSEVNYGNCNEKSQNLTCVRAYIHTG
jgi:ribosome maturation protein Sdo1